MESQNTESDLGSIVQDNDSTVRDNIRKFDIFFVPSSYIRTMRGTMNEIEKSGHGPVHILDKLHDYGAATALELVRLAGYSLMLYW